MAAPANPRPHPRLRRALIVTTVVGGTLALLGGLVWGGQRSLVYLPSGGEPPPAGEMIDGAEDVHLHTEDGLELGGWYVPASEPTRDAAVLVTNGNAGNRESRVPLARALSEEGFSVLLFDYRGYGGNPGSPTESGLTTDARAAANVLAERGHTKDRVLYWGESLGAGVAVNLATERPPAGLFLRSPFTSLADMAGEHYPIVPSSILRDTYPVRDIVSELDVPTSVASGGADTIVPAEQSHQVAEACPHLIEEIVLPDAGHNEAAMVHGPEVVAGFVRLADRVL